MSVVQVNIERNNYFQITCIMLQKIDQSIVVWWGPLSVTRSRKIPSTQIAHCLSHGNHSLLTYIDFVPLFWYIFRKWSRKQLSNFVSLHVIRSQNYPWTKIHSLLLYTHFLLFENYLCILKLRGSSATHEIKRSIISSDNWSWSSKVLIQSSG